jgi:hypothetical protein
VAFANLLSEPIIFLGKCLYQDSCFSVVPLVEMVELLIGFVGFCGLSLLNAPWSTVPLLLPLFGSVKKNWLNVLPLFFPGHIDRGKKNQHSKL